MQGLEGLGTSIVSNWPENKVGNLVRRPEYEASTTLPTNSLFTSSSPLSSFPSFSRFQLLPHSSSSSASQPASLATLHTPCTRSPVTVTSVDLFLRCLKGPTTSLFIRTRGMSNLDNDARLANGSTYEWVYSRQRVLSYQVGTHRCGYFKLLKKSWDLLLHA